MILQDFVFPSEAFFKIKLKNNVIITQYGNDWLPSPVYKDTMIGYHPNTNWSSTTYETCDDKEKTLLDGHAKDHLMSVKGCSMRMPGGGTLKAFLKAHSAVCNNAATCY